MKNHLYPFILFGLLLFSQVALAQSTKPAFPSDGKGVAGDWGITLNINGLIDQISVQPLSDISGNPILSARYFSSDRSAFRLGLGINAFRKQISRVDSIGNDQVEYDSTSTQFSLFLNPSYEWHFTQNKRLDPYIGVGLHLAFIGNNRRTSTTLTTDTTGTARREYDGQFPGGFQIGAFTRLGFNYFIAPKLALGAEYTLGVFNRRTGGDYNEVLIQTPITGQSTVDRTLGSNLDSELAFRYQNNAVITLSYFFAKNK